MRNIISKHVKQPIDTTHFRNDGSKPIVSIKTRSIDIFLDDFFYYFSTEPKQI